MAGTKTAKKTDFESTIAAVYAAQGKTLELGKGVLDGKVAPKAIVQVPLRMTNRHGLIAGATGTGKTKGLQGIAEQLSEAGVSVFTADMKGDLSGLSEPGGSSGIAADRWKELGETFEPKAFPVEPTRAKPS